MRLTAILLLLARSSAEDIVTLGQVRQVSFNDPADGDVDSRDSTVVEDGNCFIYSSENILGNTDLSYGDWRTWKTCGVFDGQTLTNTLISDPMQSDGTEYTYPQASNDGSVVCFQRKIPPRDYSIVMGVDGTYTQLSTDGKSTVAGRGCDVSYDGSTVAYAEEDDNDVLQVYLYDRQSSAATKISDAGTLKALWPRTSSDGSSTVFVSEKTVHDPTLTTLSSGSKYSEPWIYSTSQAESVRIADLSGQQCNRTRMYELIVQDWGLENVIDLIAEPSKLGNGGSTCAPAPPAPARGLAAHLGLFPHLTHSHLTRRAAPQLPVLRRQGRHKRRRHDLPGRQRGEHLR